MCLRFIFIVCSSYQWKMWIIGMGSQYIGIKIHTQQNLPVNNYYLLYDKRFEEKTFAVFIQPWKLFFSVYICGSLLFYLFDKAIHKPFPVNRYYLVTAKVFLRDLSYTYVIAVINSHTQVVSNSIYRQRDMLTSAKELKEIGKLVEKEPEWVMYTYMTKYSWHILFCVGLQRKFSSSSCYQSMYNLRVNYDLNVLL